MGPLPESYSDEHTISAELYAALRTQCLSFDQRSRSVPPGPCFQKAHGAVCNPSNTTAIRTDTPHCPERSSDHPNTTAAKRSVDPGVDPPPPLSNTFCLPVANLELEIVHNCLQAASHVGAQVLLGCCGGCDLIWTAAKITHKQLATIFFCLPASALVRPSAAILLFCKHVRICCSSHTSSSELVTLSRYQYASGWKAACVECRSCTCCG